MIIVTVDYYDYYDDCYWYSSIRSRFIAIWLFWAGSRGEMLPRIFGLHATNTVPTEFRLGKFMFIIFMRWVFFTDFGCFLPPSRPPPPLFSSCPVPTVAHSICALVCVAVTSLEIPSECLFLWFWCHHFRVLICGYTKARLLLPLQHYTNTVRVFCCLSLLEVFRVYGASRACAFHSLVRLGRCCWTKWLHGAKIKARREWATASAAVHHPPCVESTECGIFTWLSWGYRKHDSPFPGTRVLQMAFGMCCCTSVMYQMIRAKQLQASKIRHVRTDCILKWNENEADTHVL